MEHTIYKVLLVDDDQFLLDIYDTKFRQEGLEVKTVSNGEDALGELRNNSDFDAVILDMVMPAMDGIALLKAIRENSLAGKAALIVLSNQGQPSDIDNANTYNIDGYIVKASSIPSEVLEEVLSIIKKKQSNV